MMSGAGEAPQPPGSGPWDLASGRSTHARGSFARGRPLSGSPDPACGIQPRGYPRSGISTLGGIYAQGDLRSGGSALGGNRAGLGEIYPRTGILCSGEATATVRLSSSGLWDPASATHTWGCLLSLDGPRSARLDARQDGVARRDSGKYGATTASMAAQRQRGNGGVATMCAAWA